jgi:hypothetical protein
MLNITSERPFKCTIERKANSDYYIINLLQMILENKGFELIFSEMYNFEVTSLNYECDCCCDGI